MNWSSPGLWPHPWPCLWPWLWRYDHTDLTIRQPRFWLLNYHRLPVEPWTYGIPPLGIYNGQDDHWEPFQICQKLEVFLWSLWGRLKEETHSPLLRYLLNIIKEGTCETPLPLLPCFISCWVQRLALPGHLCHRSHKECMASPHLIQHPLICPATPNIVSVVTSEFYLLLLLVVLASWFCSLCLIIERIFLAIWAGWVFVHGKNN